MASKHSRNKECQKRGTATEHAEREGPGGRATWHALEHAMGLPRGAATEHAEGGPATLHDMEDAQAELIRVVHNFAPDGDGHASGHSDLSQSWTARAERAESSARPSQPEDLMLRADGDVADVELQRVLALDILGPQAANALRNIYNLQIMRVCSLATLRAMVERERLQHGQISLLTERLVSMIEQGIPHASVLNIVSPRNVTADYLAIWADWIDVALLHFNSRHGRQSSASCSMA